MDNISVRQKAILASQESKKMLSQSATLRTEVLDRVIESLEKNKQDIFEANKMDLSIASDLKISNPLLKRLVFDEIKLELCIKQLKAIKNFEDPLALVLEVKKLDHDLVLKKIRSPLGLIAFIFESRPDALIQVAGLCIRSANALIAKGGSEALNTNKAIFKIILEASTKASLGTNWLSLLESREEVEELFELNDYIDLLVPRGSKDFVSEIIKKSQIPVLGHADGICHSYVHEDIVDSDKIDMALKLLLDSKKQYPATCNALETILINKSIVKSFVQELAKLFSTNKIKMNFCQSSFVIIKNSAAYNPEYCFLKEDNNWSIEYLDLEVSIKVVSSLSEAIEHINKFGSKHSDSIITLNSDTADIFLKSVDSSSVIWNASTRFSDGYRYGLGAELGIATGKIHARGPVGIEGLLTYKWVLEGSGHIVADYSEGRKKFLHEE